MSTSRMATKTPDSTEARNISIAIGKLPEGAQVTIQDTGWSEAEKDRMRQAGYDDVVWSGHGTANRAAHCLPVMFGVFFVHA